MADIINNNIYGGAIIPSSFVFDFVHYGSYSTLKRNKDWESMAIGRHCLIKYCNYAFTTGERIAIEQGSEPSDKTSNEYLYYTCFKADGDRSYDGLILQKTKDGPLMIGYTNHGVDTGILITESENSIDKNANDIVQLQNIVINEETGLVKKVGDLSTTVGALSTAVGENETPTGLYKSISDIKSDIGSVEDEATETTVYGAINKLNQEVNDTLIPHIADFESRTRWNHGISSTENGTVHTGPILNLKLENNGFPSDEAVGTLIVNKKNEGIAYSFTNDKDEEQVINLSQRINPTIENPVFNGGFSVKQGDQELAKTNFTGENFYLSTRDGILPVVQVQGTDGYSPATNLVKIYIGSNAPTSGDNEIGIWIKIPGSTDEN